MHEGVKTTQVASLEQAIDLAKEIAEPGNVVLFSPACASFDMFENYVARGEAFRQAVKKIVLQEGSE